MKSQPFASVKEQLFNALPMSWVASPPHLLSTLIPFDQLLLNFFLVIQAPPGRRPWRRGWHPLGRWRGLQVQMGLQLESKVLFGSWCKVDLTCLGRRKVGSQVASANLFSHKTTPENCSVEVQVYNTSLFFGGREALN